MKQKANIQELRELYREFLKIQSEVVVAYVKNANNTDATNKLTDREIRKIYDAYYRPSFFVFLRDLKTAIYAESIFEFAKTSARDAEYVAGFTEFFKKTRVARLEKDGKVTVLKKDMLDVLPRPQGEDEIKNAIEQKLGVKIQAHAPVLDLVGKKESFQAKSKFDQLSVSQAAAIFEVKKILENLPLPGTFLFVGDDDFISVLLSLADPTISSIVVDADEELLSAIRNIAQRYSLDIRVKKADAAGKNVVGQSVVGFLCNPPYTHKGVETFVRYGLKNFSDDGGVVLLTVGDEAIGNRFLALQRFFTSNNLVTKEIIKGAVEYPFVEAYPSDTVVRAKFLAAGVSQEAIKNGPHLGASVYVFDYIPYAVPPYQTRQSIYTYL